MQKCVACNSQNGSNSNVIFHTLPKNPERKNLWLKSLKLNSFSHWARVCSKHFSPEDYKPGCKRWLLHSAVPKPIDNLSPNNIDESPNNTDESPNIIDNSLNNVDNTLDNVDNTLNHIDENAPTHMKMSVDENIDKNVSTNVDENSPTYMKMSVDENINKNVSTHVDENAPTYMKMLVDENIDKNVSTHVDENAPDLIIDENSSGFIIDENTSNLIIDENSSGLFIDENSLGLIIDENSLGLIIDENASDIDENASDNIDYTLNNIDNASNNTGNISNNIDNTPNNIENAANNIDEVSNSSIQTPTKELVYTDNVCKIQQTLASNEISQESHITNNFSSPRRSSRKMKPVTADDFVTYQNKSLNQNNGEKNCSPKKIKLNIAKNSNVGKMSGIRCSVKNCQNKQSKSISFFGYPLSNKELRELWIQNCGIQDLLKPNEKFKTNLKVCACHFEENMFINPLKRNRIKPNAIPTLFFNSDLNNTSPAACSSDGNLMVEDTSNCNNMESGTKECQSVAIMKKPSNLSFNKSVNDVLNTSNELVSNNVINSNCCIQGCINHANYDKTMKSLDDSYAISLLAPPSNEVMKVWSSALGVPLTPTSLLCERHFKPGDIVSMKSFTEKGIIEERSLLPGAMPIIKPKKRILKRQKVNIVNNDLLIKKSKLGDLQIITKCTTDKTRCEDTEPVDKHSTTLTDPNNAQSSFKQLLPKILSNKSLSITLEPNNHNGIQISGKELNQINKPSIVLLPSTNTKYEPNNVRDDNDDDDDILSIISSNNSIISDSLPSSSKQIPPTNLTNTIVQSTTILNTEPMDILSTVSANCLTNTPHSSIEKILSKTLNNNSLSITLESNTNKQSKNISNSSSTEAINSTAILKSVESTDNAPVIVIADDDDEEEEDYGDDDDDYIFESEYSQSSFMKVSPSTSANKSSNIYLKQNNNQDKQMLGSVELINSNVCLKPTPKQNMDLINTLPSSSSENSTLPSCLKQILSKNTFNNSLSITLKSNYNSVTTTSSNKNMPKIVQSNYKQSEKEYATTQNTSSHQFSTNNTNRISTSQFIKPAKPISEVPKSIKLNTHSSTFDHSSNCDKIFFCNEEIYKKSKEVVVFINTSSIIEARERILFPNYLWKCLYNIHLNKIIFIQRDGVKGPVKKIEFQFGLIPNICINGRQYKCNEAVNTKHELEALLIKIDDIEICFGYDGYTHDQCIGYFDNVNGENEACDRCKDLLKSGYLSSMDALLKSKLDHIKQLENKIAEGEVRVLQAREVFNQKKRKEEIQKALAAIQPSTYFSNMKPLDYI